MTTGLVLGIFAATMAASVSVYLLTVPLDRAGGRNRHIVLLAVVIAYAVVLWLQPPSLVVSNTAVVGVAAVAGAAIGRTLRSKPSIVAFSVAASVADVVSFGVGPTNRLLENADRTVGSLISYLALSIPHAERIVPVAGVGDLLLLSVYIVALKTVGASAPARFVIPLTGLLAALAVGLASGGAFGVPFMAAAVIVYMQVVAHGRRQAAEPGA
jgi:hypothetical protein